MDAGAHERQCQTLHGLVSAVPMAWRTGFVAAARWPGGRAVLGLFIVICLVAALTGGLLRMGLALPWSGTAWAGHAAVAHAALMIPAFFAAVIGLERAVAVRTAWAFGAPALAAAGGIAIAFGQHVVATWLALAGAAVFVAVNVAVVRKQSAAHTWVLLAGAVALLLGNAAQVAGLAPLAAISFWFAFLVVTIAAERLEMTRMMRRRPAAQAALLLLLAALLAASAAAVASPLAGAAYGMVLALLAAWLGAFDIARRTLHARGLSRYMAVCLLAGYGWLAVAGVAWSATSLGWPWRDAALHALGLGFVFSMIFGHAPVILPAVAGVKIAFSPVFYLPLALLHGSVAWRLLAGGDATWRPIAGALHLLALLGFAAALAWGAWRWRRLHGALSARRPRAGAASGRPRAGPGTGPHAPAAPWSPER